ncbi:MAG: hypothetical protein DRJ09_12090, partial [Bacteroidetes bacterium]
MCSLVEEFSISAPLSGDVFVNRRRDKIKLLHWKGAYLFAGSERGAERAAMFYSFFGTCKKNDVNPFNWL